MKKIYVKCEMHDCRFHVKQTNECRRSAITITEKVLLDYYPECLHYEKLDYYPECLHYEKQEVKEE